LRHIFKMFSQDKETRHIWHPDLFEIFEQARLQKSLVTIQSHLPLDLCNTADLTLSGRFGSLVGQQAKFKVESIDMFLEKRFPVDPGCEYAFALDLPMGGKRYGRIEYAGKATILDRILQKNDLPDELLLRVSLPSRIRHMRRHQRRKSEECQDMIPGLILIDREPTDRRQLLRLLSHYFRKNNARRPRLINISAGGVCVETSDSSGYRLLAADERYLFFFFLKSPQLSKLPIVFLGRKVGAFKASESGSAALRIQFLRELVWKGQNMELEWQDVSGNGSDRMRKILGIPAEDLPKIAELAMPEQINEEPRKRRPRITRKIRQQTPDLPVPEIPPLDQMACANMAQPFKKFDE